jgi:hypothetical protein
MNYFFDIEYYTTICNYDNIINGGGEVIENKNDGTVSVFINEGDNLVPFSLGKFCCEKIKETYIWDADNQQCRWVEKSNDLCGLNNPFKLVLNPQGNDGSLFITEENQICSLEVDFNYLFKVKCETLNNILNPSILDTPENEVTLSQITLIENQIENRTQQCNQIAIDIEFFQNLVLTTNYSVECDETGTWCLTDEGLIEWANILSNLNYQKFIQGNPQSYDCLDVTTLLNQNQSNIFNGLPNLMFLCTVPFGTKTDYINHLNVLLTNQLSCQNSLNSLIAQLEALKSDLETSAVGCDKPIDFFESFDVSVTVDVVNGDSLITVFEQSFFPAIGTGNLYNYLIANENAGSGFYVCGDPLIGETNLSGCTALTIDFETNNGINVSSCETVMNNLVTTLYAESELSGVTDGQNIFKDIIPLNSFSSNWVNYNFTIEDEQIINQLVNQKVKISFKINNTCTDFCVLVDDIKLNKKCSIISETNTLIPLSPGFEIEKVIDNKKSWINNNSLDNRTFVITNNDKTKEIRQTNYDVEDERLVINSKEIDLNINIGSAIETDVWKFLVDNPCLLTATTTFNCPCTGVTSGCCGDESSIDFSNLFDNSLSEVKTIEEFKTILIGDLIDAKNRQTISNYPTLKALYDRYRNSTAYCENISSAFDYDKIDKFANLVDNYWVEIIEQVIPSTTIWGSVKIYSNTLFDQQKFKYKAYTSLICDNPFSGKTILSPINGTSGVCTTVNVISQPITQPSDELITNNPITYCDNVCIAQMNSGSEFIGTVNVFQLRPRDKNDEKSKNYASTPNIPKRRIII